MRRDTCPKCQDSKKRLKRAGYAPTRRSQVLGDTINQKIVILDSVGELHAAYGLAPNAIVGGTFGQRGGQNLLEPATMGARVFGPHTARIREEVLSLTGRGGMEVQSFRHAFTQLAYPFKPPSTEELTSAFPPCVPHWLRRYPNCFQLGKRLCRSARLWVECLGDSSLKVLQKISR